MNQTHWILHVDAERKSCIRRLNFEALISIRNSADFGVTFDRDIGGARLSREELRMLNVEFSEGCAMKRRTPAGTQGSASLPAIEKRTDMDETKIREDFERSYLGGNKHTGRRNEHGDYVLPSIQDAWGGWRAAYELTWSAFMREATKTSNV